jgi:hypothetical protein
MSGIGLVSAAFAPPLGLSWGQVITALMYVHNKFSISMAFLTKMRRLYNQGKLLAKDAANLWWAIKRIGGGSKKAGAKMVKDIYNTMMRYKNDTARDNEVNRLLKLEHHRMASDVRGDPEYAAMHSYGFMQAPWWQATDFSHLDSAPPAKAAGEQKEVVVVPKKRKLKYVSRPIRKGESKYHDFAWSNVDFSNTITTDSDLLLINEGDGPNEMIGRRIRITHISVKFWIFQNQKVASTTLSKSDFKTLQNNTGKLALVLDKQCNGAGIEAEIWELDGGAPDMYKFRNLARTHRYHIIKSWSWNPPRTWHVNGNGDNFKVGSDIQYYEWGTNANIVVNYQQQSGGSRILGELVSNNLAFAWQQRTAPVDGRTLRMTGNMRIRFQDM